MVDGPCPDDPSENASGVMGHVSSAPPLGSHRAFCVRPARWHPLVLCEFVHSFVHSFSIAYGPDSVVGHTAYDSAILPDDSEQKPV